MILKAAVENNIKEFFDLDAWKKSHKLVIEIYKLTKNFPKEELYGITAQIRRAAVSVTSNIAEGFSRYHYKDKGRFYYNSRGSISELRNLLFISADLEYINKDQFDILMKSSEDMLKLVNGLIRSLEKQIGSIDE